MSFDPIQEVVQALESGEVVIYPTETLYGMGVDAHNPKAVQKLFQLKKRPLNKPIPVLLPHKNFVDRYCKKISPVAKKLIEHFWPGALTIVLEAEGFPKGVADNNKVGFRVSSHPFARTMMYKFDRCVTATSANISDEPSPKDANEFFKIFPKGSFVLVKDTENTKPSRPSTVIDCTVEPYKILRAGAIDEQEIQKVLSELL